MFNTALAFNTNFVSIKWSTSFPGSFFSAFLGRVGRKTKRGREERPWKRGCQIVNPHDWSLEVYQWIKLAVVNKTFQHFFSTLTLIDQHYHLFVAITWLMSPKKCPIIGMIGEQLNAQNFRNVILGILSDLLLYHRCCDITTPIFKYVWKSWRCQFLSYSRKFSSI